LPRDTSLQLISFVLLLLHTRLECIILHPLIQFLSYFSSSTKAREKARFAFLDKQRIAREDAEREKARKKRLADQKLILDVDNFFTESDRQSAIDKLIKASAKYDKTSPGCMGLDAFDAAYLTPLEFREILKRVFALNLSPKGENHITFLKHAPSNVFFSTNAISTSV